MPARPVLRSAATFPHNGWVASVDVSGVAGGFPEGIAGDGLGVLGSALEASKSAGHGRSRILAGGFDGGLRVWNASGVCVAKAPDIGDRGVIEVVKAVKWLGGRVVSGGYGRCLRVWSIPGDDEMGEEAVDMKLDAELRGHELMVQGIDVQHRKDGEKVISGSADGTVRLWDPNVATAPKYEASVEEGNAAKRQRKSLTAKQPAQLSALATLSAHSDSVSCVKFEPKHTSIAYSVSLDGMLKVWNLAQASGRSATPTDSRNIAEPLLSMTALTDMSLLAAGTVKGQIVLTDPRSSVANIRVMTMNGHTNMVAGLAADPGSQYRLVSGSYDGTCRIWDIRSRGEDGLGVGKGGQAVQVLRRQDQGQGKIFTVAWDREVGIVAGTEDKKVEIYR